jgi:hypothetical protein
MHHFAIASAMALALAALTGSVAEPAAAAHHEAVVQVVTVDTKPGKLEQYRAEVKKLIAVMKRLGGSGTVRVWSATVAGSDTGNVLVGLEYPNAAAWAADSTKLASDTEWQKIVSGLDELRTVVSNAVWRELSPARSGAGSGSVLAITGVQVNPGKLGAYTQKVNDARSITERLGISGNFRIFHAELAGPNTGAVAVGVEYPDLATYVAETGKLTADAEWNKLLDELAGMRTLVGRWLYQEITP